MPLSAASSLSVSHLDRSCADETSDSGRRKSLRNRAASSESSTCCAWRRAPAETSTERRGPAPRSPRASIQGKDSAHRPRRHPLARAPSGAGKCGRSTGGSPTESSARVLSAARMLATASGIMSCRCVA
eukprot:6182567-Pleurochrysis_carterae.AAC.1